MTPEQLKFEYERRQNRISVLEMKHSNLEARRQAIDDQWAEESKYLTSARALRDYQPPSFASVDSAMDEVDSEMSRLKEECEAIETVLGESWQRRSRAGSGH
jgi:hypothetical protein